VTVGITRNDEETSYSNSKATDNIGLSPPPTLRVTESPNNNVTPSATPTTKSLTSLSSNTEQDATQTTQAPTQAPTITPTNSDFCVINNVLSIPDQAPEKLGSHEDKMVVTMDNNLTDSCSYLKHDIPWCEHSGAAVYTNLNNPTSNVKSDEKIVISYPAEPHTFVIQVKHYFTNYEAEVGPNETNDQEWVGSLSINTLSFDGTTQEFEPITSKPDPGSDTHDPTGNYENPDYLHDYYVLLECDNNCACNATKSTFSDIYYAVP